MADQSKWCSGPFTHPRLVLEVVKRVMASTAVHLRGKTRPPAPRLHLVQAERTIGDSTASTTSTTSTTPQTPSQDGHFPDFRCILLRTRESGSAVHRHLISRSANLSSKDKAASKCWKVSSRGSCTHTSVRRGQLEAQQASPLSRIQLQERLPSLCILLHRASRWLASTPNLLPSLVTLQSFSLSDDDQLD